MEFLLSMAPCAALPSGNSQVDPRKPSVTHPFSLPPCLGLSNGDHPHVSGSPTDDPAPYTLDLLMAPEDNQDPYGNLGTLASSPQPNDVHAAPKKALQYRQFLGKLQAMLEDEAMKGYISWCKVEDSDGLSIPDIEAFAENALPRYFPDMNKHWASFQRQLSNYGYKKQGRNKAKGFYVRSDKNVCRARPYPLSGVGRPAETAKPPHRVQEPPLAAYTPAVPQPPGQLDPYVRIYHLENKLKETQNVVSKLAERLQAMEALVQSMLHQPGAVPISNGSPNPQFSTGPAGWAADNDYLHHGADDLSGIDHQVVPNPQIVIHDEWASQNAPPYAVMDRVTFDSDLPPQQPAAPQPPTDTSFTGPPPTFTNASRQPPPTFTHASRQPAVEVSAPQGSGMPSGSTNLESSTLWGWPFVLLQEAGLAALGHSSSPNAPAASSTSQAPGPSRSSSSTWVSGGRKQFGGMHPVPLPPPGRRSF